HGFFKIFADNDSGEILGGSILGPRADDLIHLVSLLMHHRGTAASILTMPWYHPTLSEVILNVARQIEALRNKKGES
ncbi:MAG: pyruvate dehydrogenase, partial [Acidobacteriota bacterium]|nr:pyruvate dehydrogenase [Acidobacteriota bacterium]